MKRTYQVILFGLLIIGVMMILPQIAFAQGTVPYVEAVVDGTLGENDWYVSDVSITWLIPPDTTIYYGCLTLLDQDTTVDGIQLDCIVVDSFSNYFFGSVEIKRDATPPIVAANLPTDPPLLLSEGDSYQVDATTSTDAASGVNSIQWSLDGDGLFDDGNPAVYQAIDGLANAQSNPEMLVAQVIDHAGNVSEAAFPVVVHNLPPVFGALPDIGPLYGPYNLTAPFSDPGILDTHTGSIDWGDDILEAGVILESNGSGSLLGEHTYERRGTYTLTLTLQDKDGAAISTTQRVNVVSIDGISLPIEALFTNVSGPTVYSTAFNQISPLLLNADDTQAEAIMALDPGGCLGLLWFETGGADPQTLAPLGMCLTDPAVSAADFNAWLADDQDLPGPELHIPLELSGIGPGMAQVWTNPDPLTAGVFVQSADDIEYRRYADLVFPPGGFALTTGIDTTYRPYVSLSATASLTNIDPTTWDWIQTTFDPDDLLPAAPAPGSLVEFSGDPLPVIHDPDTLSGKMDLLQDSIGAYTYDGIIPLQTNLQLNQVLDKVVRAWRNLRDGKALLELNKFIVDVEQMVEQGQISNEDGTQLIGEAYFLIDSMLDWENFGELDPDPSTYCDGAPGSCTDTYEACVSSLDYKILIVEEGVASGGDGTPFSPLPSIAEALAYAEAVNACGVRILVKAGTYTGDLNITRHTWISNVLERPDQVQIQGLISNQGPHRLVISDITIKGNPSTGWGGIYVNHPCARLTILNVKVEDVYGYGIRQEGGSLRGTNVTVQGTMATPQYLTHGTGMYLTCGVRATLNQVDLIGNQSTGLQVVGMGTNVRIYNLWVKETSMHPTYIATGETVFNQGQGGTGQVTEYFAPILGTGGVHVRDEAFLYVGNFEIYDNISSGINVTTGAHARLEVGIVAGTRHYHDVNADGEWYAGHGDNALSTWDGNLRISLFSLQSAEHCGINVHLDGEADLFEGEVKENRIGMCFSSDYDYWRLESDVEYVDNQQSAAVYPD